MKGILLISMPGTQEYLIILIVFIFWLWTLIDCINGQFKSGNKLLWIFLIVFAPVLGSVVYLWFGRSRSAVA